MLDIRKITIRKAHELLKSKQLSVSELVKECLKIAEKENPQNHAFLEIFEDVVSKADGAQKLFDEKKESILTGIPLALKDNISIAEKISSAGSKILEHFVSPYDASATVKLKNAGALIIGRTNMDEFAMGSSTENSAFGVTRNPHDQSRVPGGSSGGSAVAVATGASIASLGSDTGGSVRQPASFCGVVGLKPTYGAVSRFGLIAMGSSLDQIGPITKSVDDAEVLFNAIKGTDPLDSTSFYPENVLVKNQLKIGIPKHLFENGTDSEILKNFEASVKKLSKSGYEIADIELPNASYALAVYYIIMPAEVSSNLSRFDGVKYGLHRSGQNLLEDYLLTRAEGFGAEARRRIMLGTYVLSAGYYDAFYGKANELRNLIRKDFENAFEKVDLILTPTTPTPAFKIGEKSDPLEMYLADIFTVPANISGNPAISLPSGFAEVDKNKLPLGIQFIAQHYRETDLFKIGKEFMQENG